MPRRGIFSTGLPRTQPTARPIQAPRTRSGSSGYAAALRGRGAGQARDDGRPSCSARPPRRARAWRRALPAALGQGPLFRSSRSRETRPREAVRRHRPRRPSGREPRRRPGPPGRTASSSCRRRSSGCTQVTRIRSGPRPVLEEAGRTASNVAAARRPRRRRRSPRRPRPWSGRRRAGRAATPCRRSRPTPRGSRPRRRGRRRGRHPSSRSSPSRGRSSSRRGSSRGRRPRWP